jgi:serine phosphatase RsbU (regulator of sigma subunit)
LDFVTFDSYLNHPREEAYNIFQDEKNLKTFKRLLTMLLILFFIITAISIGESLSFHAGVIMYLINLLFTGFLWTGYKRLVNLKNIRKYIYAFIIIELVIMMTTGLVRPDEHAEEKSTAPLGWQQQENGLLQIDTVKTDSNSVISVKTGDPEGSFETVIFFFSITLLFFRLSRNELVQLYLLTITLPLIFELVISSGVDSDYVPFVILSLVFFTIAYTSERKRYKQFYSQYDFHYGKNFESMRMKRELDSARKIQLSMLPDREARIGDVEICGISIPASEVGGDYFDYFKVSESKIGVFICDVSGHGVASALLLSGLRSCMHLILEETTNPQEVMEKLNRMVRKTQNRKMFVTAIFAIIDTEKNTCELFNAGHLPPYKISGSSGEIFKIKQHGITLGAIEKLTSESNNSRVVFEFNKNDTLVLYTDGVNEAMNAGRQEYGFEKIENIINMHSEKNPHEILNSLVDDIKNFVNDTSQRDDITILTVGRS